MIRIFSGALDHPMQPGPILRLCCPADQSHQKNAANACSFVIRQWAKRQSSSGNHTVSLSPCILSVMSAFNLKKDDNCFFCWPLFSLAKERRILAVEKFRLQVWFQAGWRHSRSEFWCEEEYWDHCLSRQVLRYGRCSLNCFAYALVQEDDLDALSGAPDVPRDSVITHNAF